MHTGGGEGVRPTSQANFRKLANKNAVKPILHIKHYPRPPGPRPPRDFSKT